MFKGLDAPNCKGTLGKLPKHCSNFSQMPFLTITHQRFDIAVSATGTSDVAPAIVVIVVDFLETMMTNMGLSWNKSQVHQTISLSA